MRGGSAMRQRQSLTNPAMMDAPSRAERVHAPDGYRAIDQFCAQSGIPRTTLYHRMEAGVVPYVTAVGRRWNPTHAIKRVNDDVS